MPVRSKCHAILLAGDTTLISTVCSFHVNIDYKCNRLQLSTNINKDLKNTSMVRINETVT